MLERDALATMLADSADTFTASFRELSPRQLAFRPGANRWTIAETAEHVILAEVGSGKLLRGRMTREVAAPDLLAATEGGEGRVDHRLLKREVPFAAPDMVMPTGRWPTAPELVGVFEESRTATIHFLRSTSLDLTRYAAPHPSLGTLNGLQWAYFLVRHCLRHVEQIDETRRMPDFPSG